MKNTIHDVNCINQIIIKINKFDSILINKYLFKPFITKYVNNIYINAFLNFPYNLTNWKLPKKLLKQNCKITFFDNTKIIISW